MRKILILLCILFLCSCDKDTSTLVNRIDDGYTLEKIAEGLEPLYGGGYRYIETENGFEIETFAGCGSNEFFKNDAVEILREEIYNQESEKYLRKYTYVSDELTSILFYGDGKYHWENELYPSYPSAFELDGTLYFSYFIDEELVLNEIVDGQLVELKRYPVNDGEYTLLGFENNENEIYFVYENDDSMKYICKENTYEFKKTDRVVIHPTCIVYSNFEYGKAIASFVIDRKTHQIHQLNENMEILMKDLYFEMPMVFNYDISYKGFIFVERIDGKVCYAYGEWNNDELKVYRLPFEKHVSDSCVIYKDNAIFYTDEVRGLLDFYVVTINE